MARVVLFNKPFRVLSQFRESGDKATLSAYFDDPTLRVAGRLDYDSEGLLVLTDDGKLLQKITHPKFKQRKTYLVQVDGSVTDEALEQLCTGVQLNDGLTLPAEATRAEEPPDLWERDPPIRYRANIPTSWIKLAINEGRNRQVRRMTAAVGFPTLRLIRLRVGEWKLRGLGLAPGEYLEE